MRIPYAAALIGAAGVAAVVGPALAKGRFDGRWSVEVVTERGDCDRAYRYPVAVENGQVRYAGENNFQISGRVQDNGRVQGSIARGDNRVSVSGRLDGTFGSGSWTAVGARSCAGRWNAERRG